MVYNARMSTNALLTSAVDNPLRDANGRYLRKPDNLPVLTSASASEASRKRWDKYRKASAKGILKEAQAIDPSVQTPADAYALVVGKQYITLLDAEKPSMKDVHYLGQIIGALPTAHDKQDTSGGVSAVVHTIDPAVMSLLAQIAEQQNAFDNSNYHNHVIEAEASDIQDTEGE